MASHFIPSDEGIIITSLRHKNALEQTLSALNDSISCLRERYAPELAAEGLRTAHTEINRVLGKEINDNVLKKIFSRFCVGK